MTLITSERRQEALLTDDMLARFDERAPIYDRENRFFDEDFEACEPRGTCSPPCPRSSVVAGCRWTT